jgi:hypothetical protein
VLALATLWPLCAGAQQGGRVYRIGYLGINPTTTSLQAEIWKGFDQSLREHGFVLGHNALLEQRFSKGDGTVYHHPRNAFQSSGTAEEFAEDGRIVAAA